MMSSIVTCLTTRSVAARLDRVLERLVGKPLRLLLCKKFRQHGIVDLFENAELLGVAVDVRGKIDGVVADQLERVALLGDDVGDVYARVLHRGSLLFGEHASLLGKDLARLLVDKIVGKHVAGKTGSQSRASC